MSIDLYFPTFYINVFEKTKIIYIYINKRYIFYEITNH